MKQYCRYCVWLCINNCCYCDKHEKVIAESTARTTNKCKDFEFCEVDAFMETDGYKPRAPRRKTVPVDAGQQISIEEVMHHE